MFNLAFKNLNEILEMGGHGIYVWSVYLVGISIIVTSFLVAKQRIKKVQKKKLNLKMLQARKNRLWKLIIILFLSAGGISLILFSLNSKLDLFYTPSEMLQADIKSEYRIKLGGMVKNGSIKRDGTIIRFLVTDFIKEVPVTFEGVPPDLFKEDSGVVILGYFLDGMFEAEEIFAKHDENYMPPELAIDEAKV
jgi:cytochrome c-type biogenesis protein CcmE